MRGRCDTSPDSRTSRAICRMLRVRLRQERRSSVMSTTTSTTPGVLQGTIPDFGYNGTLANYIWENGQNQESSRDQQHAFFGLATAAGIAEVAWNQGYDVWNSLDNRLLKGFEFMSKYNTSYVASFPDQPAPWEPDNVIQRYDRTGRWFSKKVSPYYRRQYDSEPGKFCGKQTRL